MNLDVDIGHLTDEEMVSYVRSLEALHLDKRREDIVEYASYIEVPGAPSPLTQGDRIRLLQRKQAMRRKAAFGPDENPWEDPEDEALETPDEEQLYPKKLEVPEHGKLILRSIQCLMEEEPVTG